MKRLIIILVLIVSSLSLYSQEHLKFKGIPINGSLKSFVETLKTKGYSLVDSDKGIALLEGTFAGVESCTIYVVSTNDLVWKVAAEFPSHDIWKEVKREYNNLKEAFAAKYGVKPESMEKLPNDEDYYSDGLGMMSLHSALEHEKAIYNSYFQIPNGLAVIAIKPDFHTSGCLQVIIEYYDHINTNARDNQAIEDL